MYVMDIYFKLPSGHIEKFTVEHVWTFAKMARLIEERCQISAEKMKFIHAGRVLDKKRAFCNESTLQKESTIHVLI